MNKSGMQNCSFSLNLPHCFRVEHHFILASLFPARWPENLRPVSPITQLHHPLSPLKSHPVPPTPQGKKPRLFRGCQLNPI